MIKIKNQIYINPQELCYIERTNKAYVSFYFTREGRIEIELTDEELTSVVRQIDLANDKMLQQAQALVYELRILNKKDRFDV